MYFTVPIKTLSDGGVVVKHLRHLASGRGRLPAPVQRQRALQCGGVAASLQAAAVHRQEPEDPEPPGPRADPRPDGHRPLLGAAQHGHVARRGQGVAAGLRLRLPVQGPGSVPRGPVPGESAPGRQNVRHGLDDGRVHHGQRSQQPGADPADRGQESHQGGGSHGAPSSSKGTGAFIHHMTILIIIIMIHFISGRRLKVSKSPYS